MPLTPATTDKFQKVGLPGSATNLSSPGYTVGNNALTVGATTNHPTDTLYTFAVDRAQTVNGVTSRIPGTYCEFEGIVTGATTIGSVVLKYGTAQNYPAGSFTRVYIPVSSNRENALIDGLNQDHNGKGNHKNLTDDNGNIWLERNQTASAVNQVRVTNSSTGNGVAVEANGSDTNTNIHIRGKGSGVAVLKNSELFGNFVASGGVVAISSGLIGTFSDMFFYVGGDRFKKTSVANKTYTASKDTYVDADPTNNSTLTYTEVVNGAAAPALTTNYMRIAKVVTSASAITSIVQSGQDAVGGNVIKPSKPVPANNIDFSSINAQMNAMPMRNVVVPMGWGTNASVFRVGNLVFAHMNTITSSMSVADGGALGETMPLGYRPIAGSFASLLAAMTGGTTNTRVAWSINPDGSMTYGNNIQITAATRLNGSSCWITNDPWV